MKLNIIYLGIFVAWIFSFVHAEQKFIDSLKAASYENQKLDYGMPTIRNIFQMKPPRL